MAMTPEEKQRLEKGSRRGTGIVVVVVAVVVVLIAVVVLSGVLSPPTTQKITILGAGATFRCRLITKWSSDYANSSLDYGGKTTQVQVNYNCVGSGAGITQIAQKTVDFAGSDAPLKPSERAAAPGLLHIPETIGAVTAAYNVASLSSGLNLTVNVLGENFLGKITTWNHANISALNPGVVLPNSAIRIVHPSDSSGTTFVWTSYLHLENPGWSSSLVGKSINWPLGIGASGNAGVAGKNLTTPDSLGYVGPGYTLQKPMKMGEIPHPTRNFISPS